MTKINQQLESLEKGQMEFREQLSSIKRILIQQQKDDNFTINEACEYLNISRTKLSEMRKSGILKSYKIQGKVLIKKSDLDALLESMVVEPQRA